jgi:hypothetical protein
MTNRFNFWSTLDASILAPDERRSSGSDVSLYPSEASALATDDAGNIHIIGGCNRKAWFRNKIQRQQKDAEHQTLLFDTIESHTYTATELWKFKMSCGVERDITEEAKRAGVWVDNSYRFEWYLPHDDNPELFATYGNYLIRGEVDLMVKSHREATDVIGIEIKSISGYKGPRTVFGVESRRGGWIVEPEPKGEHLLQATLYALHFIVELGTFNAFKIAYINRENGFRKEYDITLVEETVDGTIRHRVHVDGTPYKYKLYAQDILDRYRALHKHIVDDTLPTRDYDLQYDKKRIATMAKSGDLSKADMELYKKGKNVVKGDWQCSYCPFKGMCYNADRTAIVYEKQPELITICEVTDGGE